MTRFIVHVAVAAIMAGWSAPAAAASLSFTGTLTHELLGLWGPVVFNGAGVSTSVGGNIALPANAFVGTAVATTNALAAPVTGNTHVIASHGPGSFAFLQPLLGRTVGPQLTLRQVAQPDTMSRRHVFGDRSAKPDFEIVGVRSED